MTTNDALKEAKQLKKEADRVAATLSSKEHYDRMIHAGYKKVGVFMKADKIRRIRIIADAKEITLYQLMDQILGEYLENFKKQGE